MRKSIFVAALTCLMLYVPSFKMTAQNLNEKSYIEVNGYAKKEVVPDEIYLSIIINETDHSKKDGIQKLEKGMVLDAAIQTIDKADACGSGLDEQGDCHHSVYKSPDCRAA